MDTARGSHTSTAPTGQYPRQNSGGPLSDITLPLEAFTSNQEGTTFTVSARAVDETIARRIPSIPTTSRRRTMDDELSPQRAYKRHKSYPGETSFVARPPSSDMDNVALGQELTL